MLFSSRVSKFGKGDNLSAIMEEINKISIYYYQSGITKKVVTINDNNMTLSKTNINLPYNEVIPINKNYLVSRIDKSIGIIRNEE